VRFDAYSVIVCGVARAVLGGVHHVFQQVEYES
jgi:hypothetical protein